MINDLDEYGLTSDDYSVFLQKRSEWIYQELQNRIELSNSIIDESNSLKELVLGGESEKLEFKSTLRFDIKLFTVNSKLEYVIAKTIAAFLNATGGILMIGINDHGDVIGLSRDFETFGSDKQNIDGFELQLRSIVKKYLGGTFEKYLSVTFPNLDGNTICMISIQSSGKPVFVMNEGREEFYVRIGNSSIPKNRQEQSEYERLHWK
jgi:predicted HTH transcriptional regulator